MKPLQIVLLVVTGALGGAVVMKVVQRPHVAADPAPVVAQSQTPRAQAPLDTPAPVVPPVAEPAPLPAAPPPPATTAARLSRYEIFVRPPKSKRVTEARVYQQQPVRRPDPVVVAQSEPAVVPTPAAAAPPAPAPASPAEQPQSQPPPPIPPARTEPENVTPPPPPEPEPHKVTLNAGMLIPVRLLDGLSSERNMPGDAFTATLDKEIVADGFVIAERGARVEGRVVTSDRGGKVKGVSALAVELTGLHTSDGQKVRIQTDSFERRSEPSSRQDAEKVGGGAAVGAIIGAIAGGGKGAAIGAGAGAGVGAGHVLLTRGKPAALPSETRLSFRLRAPVNLTEKRSD